MDKKNSQSRRTPKIVNDHLTLSLWSRCVSVEEQNDLETMKSLLNEVQKKPYLGSVSNPILKRMVEDGAGFDGLNAAMMTYGYLQNICLYYIKEAEKRTTPH